MLESKQLAAQRGTTTLFSGIDFKLGPGDGLLVTGANGSGKTTLLRTVVGLLPAWKGSVCFEGSDVTRLSPHEKAQQGLVLIPEGRQLFTDLFMLIWLVFWTWLAVQLYHLVLGLGVPGQKLAGAGDGMAGGLSEAGSRVRQVPVAGDSLAGNGFYDRMKPADYQAFVDWLASHKGPP